MKYIVEFIEMESLFGDIGERITTYFGPFNSINEADKFGKAKIEETKLFAGFGVLPLKEV